MTTHSEPKAITIRNYRYQSTDALEAALDQLDEGDVELGEAIEDELAERELEASLPGPDEYDSLEDRGLSLGSYAS